MSVLAILMVILLLAFLVESLTEFLLGDVFDKITVLTPFKWTLKYFAVAAGVLGAFVYKFDLPALLGQYLEITIATSVFGIVLTGIAIGKGSNYLHQVISQFFPEKT